MSDTKGTGCVQCVKLFLSSVKLVQRVQSEVVPMQHENNASLLGLIRLCQRFNLTHGLLQMISHCIRERDIPVELVI
jgi:hypothetical protein